MKRMMLVLVAAVAFAPVGAQTPDSGAINRQAQLQRQLRERLATMVRTRLQLTDAQARQLQETDGRLEPERRQLFQREQRARRELRQEMLVARDNASAPANQDKVAGLIDQILAVHRDRVLLVEREQRELARYLTPLQRAQYMALQNDLRRRVEAMQRGGPRRGGQRSMGRRPIP